MLKKFYGSQNDFAADFANEFNIPEDDAYSFASLMIDCDIFKLNDDTDRLIVDRAQVYRMIGEFCEISDWMEVKQLVEYDYFRHYGDPSLMFDLSYYMQLIYKNNR